MSYFAFILAVLFRALSGAQNGAGYRRNIPLLFTISSLLVAQIVLTGVFMDFDWVKWVLGGFSAGAIIVMIEAFSFPVNGKLIHPTEIVLTAGYILALLIMDPWAVIAAHYSGMLANKAALNLVNGDKWDYNGTNDPDGSHFAVYVPKFLVGLKVFAPWKRDGEWSWFTTIPPVYNVPRSSMTDRKYLAGITALLWLAFKFSF